MLKKQLSLLLMTSTFLMIQAAWIGSTTTSNIDQAMNVAIQQAEDEVQKQFDNATRQDIAPDWNAKVQLENAIIQLEVKKTLVNNFKGTSSLQNPIIQNKLLEILNKSIITESDLAELQNLVTQEKAKLNTQTTIPQTATVPANGATGATGS